MISKLNLAERMAVVKEQSKSSYVLRNGTPIVGSDGFEIDADSTIKATMASKTRRKNEVLKHIKDRGFSEVPVVNSKTRKKRNS
jgi:hypothetical protein